MPHIILVFLILTGSHCLLLSQAYQIVWSDEFEYSGNLDTTKWFHQTQLPIPGSWYNGEIQHYTDRIENTEVNDSMLHLIARKETFTDQGVTKEHTSARLNSKFAFTYGRVEVRAKLPTGVGTWPAIWTLGQNINEPEAYWQLQGYGTTPWPACGEMDIMEHWGHNQDYVSSATHTPSSFGGTVNVGGRVIPNVSTQFHVYAMEWTPDSLIFSVDGQVHFVYAPAVQDAATWPFDKPQYLLLNTAILPSIDPNFTESAMIVDYVRVYQKPVGTGMLSPAQSPGTIPNDVEALQLRLQPNPARDHVVVTWSGAPADQIVIFNLQGQVEATFYNVEAGTRLPMPQTAGLYLMNLRIGGHMVIHPLIRANN